MQVGLWVHKSTEGCTFYDFVFLTIETIKVTEVCVLRTQSLGYVP